jgi:hypothetical protein
MDAMKSLLLAGLMGAALAAPIVSPALAQPVQTDPNGFSPFDTKTTLNENLNTPIVRNAPALGLSSIYGLNPCSLGASVGVTTPLFGVGGAISTTDRDCEVRNTAALAITGLKDEAAGREIMCGIKEFREAVARLGQPCITDKSIPVAAGTAPVAAAGTAPVAAVQPVSVPPPVKVAAGAPAFCNTPGLVLKAYPECSIAQPPEHVSVVVHPASHTAVQPEHVGMTAHPAPQTVTSHPSPPAIATKGDKKPSLMDRAAAALQAGDIVAARALYTFAAQNGNGQAAATVARTYDSAYLTSIHAIGVQPDQSLADNWNRRAALLGETKVAAQ